MTRIFPFIAIIAVLSSCTQLVKDEARDPEKRPMEQLFDLQELPTITLNVSQEQWNSLLDKYDADSQTKEYIKCDVTFESSDSTYHFAKAGLRLKGQTSRRRPEGSSGQHHVSNSTDWKRVHFGLNLRKFVKTDAAQICGIRKITLKYPKEDPTYIRETYCYDLLRRFGVWTAMYTSYCRLFIQIEGDSFPTYLGIYQMQEWIDDKYIERRPEFGSDGGYLWKCAWGSNLRDTDEWRFAIDDNSTSNKAYELKEDTGEFTAAKAQLKSFIYNLNHLKGDAFKTWIENHCDLEQLLRMYAVYVSVGHWDDYWNNMNNFYLYFSGKSSVDYKMYMLPYDCDNTLGTSHNCGAQHNSGTHNPFHWGIDECVLLEKILAIPEFKQMYAGYIKDLLNENNSLFTYEASMARINEWHDLIRPYVPNQTHEGNKIEDKPASWGNHSEYRIMEDGSHNWFRVKTESLNAYLEYASSF